jgi:hypothetical protein
LYQCDSFKKKCLATDEKLRIAIKEEVTEDFLDFPEPEHGGERSTFSSQNSGTFEAFAM